MNPNSEMMMWCHAYINKLTTKIETTHQDISRTGDRPRRRYWLIRWCGHIALSVGKWLLADELQAVERPNQSQQQTTFPSP